MMNRRYIRTVVSRLRFGSALLLLSLGFAWGVCGLETVVVAQPPKKSPDIFARNNLVAWCIVPFDGKNRGPAERAAMCARLGLKKIAYDWRAKHVPTFEREIIEYKKHGLEYFAFWGEHEAAFKLFEKYDLHPQLWKMLAQPTAKSQAERVRVAAEGILPLVKRAARMKCRVGLYNHGGWSGEPENLVAVCAYLRKHHQAEHVGIVYNLHHAHPRIDEFDKLLRQMKPYLLCLNLNGTTRDGDRRGQKILPLGEGELDVKLLKTIRDSGYRGPIGIIGHTQDDVELRLRDNLDGLEWIRPQLDGKPPGDKPRLRTWSASKVVPAPRANLPGTLLDGNAAYRSPPITVECRARLPRRDQYNILVASDTKQSAAHWEIFSMNGSGQLTAYHPGQTPDHTRSQAMICDDKFHNVAMIYEANRVRLFVDGRQVADQAIRSAGRPPVPGKLAVARLVEGGLGSSGPVAWLRISRGVRSTLWKDSAAPQQDSTTLLRWVAGKPKDNKVSLNGGHSHGPSDDGGSTPILGPTPKYSARLVARLLKDVKARGDAGRGVMVFSSAKNACLSCHQVGRNGGTVGPPLADVSRQRKPEEIVESVLWPGKTVDAKFQAETIVTDDGRTHTGYILKQTTKDVVLRDPTRGVDHRLAIPLDHIELRRKAGTLMPDNLVAAMTKQQLLDLLRFLTELGRPGGSVSLDDVNSMLDHAYAHRHGPAKFPVDRRPLNPAHWPNWQHPVNRDRLYDFYAKQADYFRKLLDAGKRVPPLLMEYPGLDGGTLGHWGNQNEETWASGAWNDVRLGRVLAGVFRGAGVTVPRGVCVRIGDDNELACCFNPDTLSYDAVWQGGFLKFSSVRHGFLHGVMMAGTAVPHADRGLGPDGKKVAGPFAYEGYYRVGKRVVFAYKIGKTRYLDSPWIENGKFVRQVAPRDEHPLAEKLDGGSRNWPQRLKTTIRHGDASPYAVDTIEFPSDNPWNIPLFGGGVGFLADGSALVCTMHGDVWRVEGLKWPSRTATWSRFASGLHHCQGLIVDKDGIFVLGRDQLTRLHDLNNDGEADWYECFSNAYATSSAGHDFICGLERDAAGNFYTSSGNQGVVRISKDGKRADVMATGFRNPDGIGLSSDGLLTVPCSEGDWTPASMICAFRPPASGKRLDPPPFFGHRGPQTGRPLRLPLVYLPRGLDNSAGGQQAVRSDRWGPLQGRMLHFSFGTGSHFLLLRDEVDGQMQGAVVPLPGDFQSGIHRGCFSPDDGQLYVTGMQGWGSYTPESGCFQRVRYTGKPVQLPLGFQVFRNGVLVRFAEQLDAAVAGRAASHFVQCWNYRYSGAYGSAEFSARHYGMRGHDHLAVRSAHVVNDGRGLFLELPDLQPVNQLHLRIASGSGQHHDLFATVHRLRRKSFVDAPGLKPLDNKTIMPHPIVADLALATRSVPNPHARRRKGGRKIVIKTADNLSFAIRSFRVKAGEKLELTLANPDVVPHNLAMVKPGTLRRVGELANKLISDPEAAVRHYIPRSSDVLFYTNVVLPGDEFTIYVDAPSQPGRYPFLCTFPGHWLVMNGEMIVE